MNIWFSATAESVVHSGVICAAICWTICNISVKPQPSMALCTLTSSLRQWQFNTTCWLSVQTHLYIYIYTYKFKKIKNVNFLVWSLKRKQSYAEEKNKENPSSAEACRNAEHLHALWNNCLNKPTPPREDFMNMHDQLMKKSKRLDGFTTQASHVSLVGPTVIIDKCLLRRMRHDLGKETRV